MIRICTVALFAVLALTSCGSTGKSNGGGSNMPYMEKELHGRVYVAGTQEGMQRLEKGEGFPYERTIIGGAAGNRTLKLEIDKDDESMTDKLHAEYNRRHDMK